MLALMLHDTGGETFHHFLVLLPILIPISHTNRFRARHFLVYTRQAQAAFLHSYFLLATFQKLGINQRTLETLAFREVISHHITVYNHQTDRQAHLRSGKPYPISIIHRFKHIGNQLFQVGIIFRYILSLFS